MRRTVGLTGTYFAFHPICIPLNEAAIIRSGWLKQSYRVPFTDDMLHDITAEA